MDTSVVMASDNAPAGTMIGTDAIAKDHDRIRALFKQYTSLAAADKQGKLSVARQIVTTISQHASAEERTIYPMILTKMSTVEGHKLLYDMMCTDDNINKLCLDYLNTHSPSSEADWQLYDQLMTKFISIELEHLDKEERTVLQPLTRFLSPVENEQLYDEWQVALNNAPIHPHPFIGGTSALAAKITHPLAGAVDKASHAVSGLVSRVFTGKNTPEHEGHAKAMEERDRQLAMAGVEPIADA